MFACDLHTLVQNEFFLEHSNLLLTLGFLCLFLAVCYVSVIFRRNAKFLSESECTLVICLSTSFLTSMLKQHQVVYSGRSSVVQFLPHSVSEWCSLLGQQCICVWCHEFDGQALQRDSHPDHPGSPSLPGVWVRVSHWHARHSSLLPPHLGKLSPFPCRVCCSACSEFYRYAVVFAPGGACVVALVAVLLLIFLYRKPAHSSRGTRRKAL